MNLGARTVGGMLRAEWVRAGVGGSLVALVAFGLGSGTGGHQGAPLAPVGADTASVVPTSSGGVDVACMGALRDDAHLGLRLLMPGVPRAGCEGFDAGAVALAFMDAIVFECERSLVDGSGPGACVGVSHDELVRMGVAVHRPVPADPESD